ncbi:E3 ubiquitin-protein ligase TRIM39 [Nothobranchius furzeri]|uniref:E3 ubiquitin-protein ligase TRIM21-like n=2 Tax=Nothobranchius furzeri TaxID=105023 RepID=A0A8C6P6M8_NOTFU|nr:E3 ubiquitin-protein ligase TRIM21 [Nothobranchius furzeri]KAF7199226.1 E3 ubiquitin-protein ligase TRIM21-like [Nothobranchius furzeri]
MASATSLVSDETLCCPICLDVFTKPVSIPCGHTFCNDCITRHWATGEVLFDCPLCKEQFHSKPMLRVNIFIAEVAEKFRKKVETVSNSIPEQAERGNVLCSNCPVPKSMAIKSCLVCFMSFCQTHLEPHLKISALKRHKLIPPARNLESRICRNHLEPLEFFCRVDQMFLCASCRHEEHKTHKTVTLEEEAQTRKKQLGMEKDCADQMIQDRQQKIREIHCSLEASRKNAEEALSCSSHVMAAVVDYVKRGHNELREVTNTKLKRKEQEANELIKELDAEMKEIKQKNLQLSQFSVTDDCFTFLEDALSFTMSLPEVRDWSNVMLDVDPFAVQENLTELKKSVTAKTNNLCDPNFRERQRYAVNVTFDLNTANPLLSVSDDGKLVALRNRKRQVLNKPERFDSVLNVLANEGFSSRKFYYEVQVRGKTQWDLGVVRESINRKGDIRLSPKNGYWTVCLREGKEITANAGPAISLHVRQLPQKVGVFVDYDGGEVSFYDADARANIFSFMGCVFTEKLFPFFSPCGLDGGKNSAPLIITPVTDDN